MQTKKMSLANIKGKLSRTEMKNFMAGSSGSTQCFSCTEGAKEWGFGCPSPLRSDCTCSSC